MSGTMLDSKTGFRHSIFVTTCDEHPGNKDNKDIKAACNGILAPGQ